MKIRITAPGIFGAKGEIPVGADFEVTAVPEGWAGRVTLLEEVPKPKAKPVTNPARPSRADLEKRAQDLKLTFDARTSDEDLAKAVEEKAQG